MKTPSSEARSRPMLCHLFKLGILTWLSEVKRRFTSVTAECFSTVGWGRGAEEGGGGDPGSILRMLSASVTSRVLILLQPDLHPCGAFITFILKI